jgi:hypothetical protein
MSHLISFEDKLCQFIAMVRSLSTSQPAATVLRSAVQSLATAAALGMLGLSAEAASVVDPTTPYAGRSQYEWTAEW